MKGRIKPFAYDAVETDTAVLFVFGCHGADDRPADKLLAANGFQITRADGTVIRMGNLHPRLREVLEAKLTYAIELEADAAVLYPVGTIELLGEAIRDYFPERFYWYIGPETSTIRDVAERPLARLIDGILHQPVAVAPGDTVAGPPIGLCQSRRGILPLARGRQWCQARAGLIIDAGLAAGTATGYPATNDIDASVAAAHADGVTLPQHRDRSAWSSQIAVAFPPKHPEMAKAS